MATHSNILAWRLPGTEKPGGLPSMGSYRVGHDWSDLAAAAAASISGCMILKKSISASRGYFLIPTMKREITMPQCCYRSGKCTMCVSNEGVEDCNTVGAGVLSKKGRTGQRLISLDCMGHRTESESQSPSPQKVFLELSIHPQPTEISKRSSDSILSWTIPFNTPSSHKLLFSEQPQMSSTSSVRWTNPCPGVKVTA